jgi:photosystem II stability/assembly factor-like uncharacterized protein
MDLYRLNFELGENCNHIQPSLGQFNTRSGELMNSCGPYLSDHSAYAMNANLHKRRGFYGEFLYDMPQTCRVRVLDAYYRPIANANLNFYKDTNRSFDAPATFTGTTDAAGYFTLPNRNSYAHITTATGHTLHNNPWGLINVVGFNAVMFCTITAGIQTDYQYMEILPFNIAYQAGYHDNYTYDLQTNIIPEGRPTTRNLNGINMSSATNGYVVGDNGTILKYQDQLWTLMTSPVTKKLTAVDIDSVSGAAVAVGETGTVLLKTASGNWLRSTSYTNTTNLKACARPSSSVIIVGGSGGVLYRSTNTGTSWTRLYPTTNDILSIDFYNSTRGIMLTNGPRVYYTTNGGSTWTTANNDLDYWWTVSDCCMSSTTEAWVCSQNGDIMHSTDGAKTWVLEQAGTGRALPLMCIDVRPGGNGWSCSSESTVVGTGAAQRLDNFKSVRQTILTSGANGDFYDISCVNGNDAWAVGEGGLILHLVSNNVDTHPSGTVAEAQELDDDSQVVMTDAAVTASFPGAVYVESTDRSTGMKLLTNQTLTPGTRVQVRGILGTDGLERVVRYGDLLSLSTGNIGPLGLSTRYMTGAASDKGLKTIPLLVRICGKVTARDASAGWFTVDDGSGKKDALGNSGVKVTIVGVTPPSIGAFVVITGINSFETASGKTYPVIRGRGPDDLQ